MRSKRRNPHASVVRSDGRYWCVCGYQAPRQLRPGSPKARQAVEQHVQHHLGVPVQDGTLVARVDHVVDTVGGNTTIYMHTLVATTMWHTITAGPTFTPQTIILSTSTGP